MARTPGWRRVKAAIPRQPHWRWLLSIKLMMRSGGCGLHPGDSDIKIDGHGFAR
jgi:hypothetical protein